MDKPFKYVDRTCTEVSEDPGGADRTESRPLSHYRDHGAYVLLGAPGTGKTEEFKEQFKREGEKASRHEAVKQGFCDARDFVTLGHKRWSNVKTLFIDGLDEMRAGTADGRTPLDAIRAKLDKLELPRFRLSCREADWFGAADRHRLESVSRDGVVKVLRLDPLSDDGIRQILRAEAVGDPDSFIHEARERGIEALLSNPLTLKLLAVAVADGAWPDTRTTTFEAACKTLLRERNEEHRQAAPQHNDSELLNAAGRLCAVQLLTGRTGYCQPRTTTDDGDCIEPGSISTPPQDTPDAVLKTRLFHGRDRCIAPIHQPIAEFLAGRYLSSLIDGGLPVRRILALLTGEDGLVVSPLGGLAAWLAAHCKAARAVVVELDPLRTVLYGDVKGFSVDEKRYLLGCLERKAERDPQIFNAIHDLDSRWGDLATLGMEAAFREILTAPGGGYGKQAVALAVLQSIKRGAAVSGITPILLDIVRAGERWPAVRIGETALEAYVRQARDQRTAGRELKKLLDDVYAGSISDPFDNLLGLLLKKLYPKLLPPAEVGRYLRERQSTVIGRYTAFWDADIARQSTDDQLAGVLDSLVATYAQRGWTGENGKSPSYWLRTIPAKLLAKYLDGNPTVDSERLFAWLDLATRYVDAGEQSIRAWFCEHPSSYKAVVRRAVDRYAKSLNLIQDTYSRLHFFIMVEPSDFGAWCLAQVAKTSVTTEASTEFFLRLVVARQHHEGISDETVERSLANDPRLLTNYKELRQLQESNSSEYASKSIELQQRREAETDRRRKEWHDLVKDHRTALRENRAAPALLHDLASAYLACFVDVQGTDGRTRLLDLLGDNDLVDLVIHAFRASTTRADLPDAAEIFRLAHERQHHLLMLPVLVGLDERSSASSRQSTARRTRHAPGVGFSLQRTGLLETEAGMVPDRAKVSPRSGCGHPDSNRSLQPAARHEFGSGVSMN